MKKELYRPRDLRQVKLGCHVIVGVSRADVWFIILLEEKTTLYIDMIGGTRCVFVTE